MSAESLDRTVIVQQLVDTAIGIKRTAFDTKRDLTQAEAVGQALLKVGRIYLLESLRVINEGAVASFIDDYLMTIPPLQLEQLKVGISFGILGCAIAALEDPQNYLAYYNNYIIGTPIPTKPTERYKQAEELLQQLKGKIEYDKESQRLKELATKDPTLISILSDFESLPKTVRIHLSSLHPAVDINRITLAIPMYQQTLAALSPQFLPAKDQDWLEKLLENFKS